MQKHFNVPVSKDEDLLLFFLNILLSVLLKCLLLDCGALFRSHSDLTERKWGDIHWVSNSANVNNLSKRRIWIVAPPLYVCAVWQVCRETIVRLRDWHRNITVIAGIFNLHQTVAPLERDQLIILTVHQSHSRNACKHSRIDLLNLSHTDGQRLLRVSSFHVVGFSDGSGVLGQTRQAVDGVCGHSDHVPLLQGLHRAAQDFSIICSSKATRLVDEGSTTEKSTW